MWMRRVDGILVGGRNELLLEIACTSKICVLLVVSSRSSIFVGVGVYCEPMNHVSLDNSLFTPPCVLFACHQPASSDHPNLMHGLTCTVVMSFKNLCASILPWWMLHVRRRTKLH